MTIPKKKRTHKRIFSFIVFEINYNLHELNKDLYLSINKQYSAFFKIKMVFLLLFDFKLLIRISNTFFINYYQE